MNALDSHILNWINTIAGKSEQIDHAVYLLSETALFKGVVVVALFFWFWFHSRDNDRNRKIILSAMIGSGIAVALSRFLAKILPFRFKPINHPDLGFTAPLYTNPRMAEELSCFPSDHAAVYVMLAVSILYLSRKAGAMMLIYITLIIGLPILYVGEHFPTDLLAGALLGVIVALIVHAPKIRNVLTGPLLRHLDKSPHLFYTCFFLFSYLLATNFMDVRVVGKFLAGIL